MAKQLTPKQKQQVIADYVDCGNYSETGRKHGISKTSVRNIVKADTELSEKFQRKKDEVTANLEKEIEQLNDSVLKIYKKGLIRIFNELDTTKDVLRIATAIATLYDKQLKSAELNMRRQEVDAKMREVAIKESMSKGVDKNSIEDSMNQLEKMVEISRAPLPPHELP